MNTANLQIEGLLLALAALLEAIEAKGLLSREEVRGALGRAEALAASDPKRPAGVSGANADAILFPIRFLQSAIERTGTQARGFGDIATTVGQTKPDR